MNNVTEQVVGWDRQEITRNIADDIPDGSYVNLGIGMPEGVVSHIPTEREVIFHTENGLLGMGPPPTPGNEDPELINAGKKYVTTIPGASFFHHADSFAMIRGGHIDICVLGAMQVAENGDLANWSMGPADTAPAVGGAMDLVAGAKTIFIATRHCTKTGEPKLVESCSYPVTGLNVVSRIYTDLATISVGENGFEILAMAPGIDLDYVQQRTAAKLSLLEGINLRSTAK